MSALAANRDSGRPHPRRWLRLGLLAAGVVFVITAVWCLWLYTQIGYYATRDHIRPADAIAVFGAAEYDGRPSPVYRARLDHARTLYEHGIARLIITLGGNGGDQFSEGMVGRDYLVSLGIPAASIIAETESRHTEESARRIAVIARVNGIRRLVIVSVGTHLFRIHEICAANGLNVLTSPRPQMQIPDRPAQFQRILHEIVSYTLCRLHLR
jgi:uncharacterized SAM-binding protein YcdF (DUF218 family)